MTRMVLPKGTGGFDIHGRIYLPDASGFVEVDERDAKEAERYARHAEPIPASAFVATSEDAAEPGSD